MRFKSVSDIHSSTFAVAGFSGYEARLLVKKTRAIICISRGFPDFERPMLGNKQRRDVIALKGICWQGKFTEIVFMARARLSPICPSHGVDDDVVGEHGKLLGILFDKMIERIDVPQIIGRKEKWWQLIRSLAGRKMSRKAALAWYKRLTKAGKEPTWQEVVEKVGFSQITVTSWGPWYQKAKRIPGWIGNQGGFEIGWSLLGTGFGNLIFHKKKNGTLYVETEGMGPEFCTAVMKAMLESATPV